MDWPTLALQYGVGAPGYIAFYFLGKWFMDRSDKDLQSRMDLHTNLREMTETLRELTALIRGLK